MTSKGGDALKRIWLVVLLLCVGSIEGPAAAQREEDALSPIDWWDHRMLAAHVDTFSGKVALLADGTGRVAVVIDVTGEGGVRDGKADHVFVFQANDAGLGSRQLQEMGTVKFWHEGIRVSLPELGESIELRLKDSTPPRTARSWGRPTSASSEGVSLVEKSGAVVERLVVDDLLVVTKLDDCSWNPDTCIDYQDYQPPGGSGGSCARSCSVGCAGGTCSGTCNSGFRASCECLNYGAPRCTCWPC